jgi:hypothetical protein
MHDIAARSEFSNPWQKVDRREGGGHAPFAAGLGRGANAFESRPVRGVEVGPEAVAAIEAAGLLTIGIDDQGVAAPGTPAELTVWQKAVLGRRAHPPAGGWAVVDDLQSLLGVVGDLVVKGAHTNPCQAMPCPTKGQGPQDLVAAGLSREPKNKKKKTSLPDQGKRV